MAKRTIIIIFWKQCTPKKVKKIIQELSVKPERIRIITTKRPIALHEAMRGLTINRINFDSIHANLSALGVNIKSSNTEQALCVLKN